MPVADETVIAIPEHEVFGPLADLDRHRLLTDHAMRILRLACGGRIWLRRRFRISLRRLAAAGSRG
jgi:hypothetical protein